MSQWEKVTLGNEFELRYGKALPAHKRQPGIYLVYGSNGSVGNHQDFLVEGPGIIVGRKGSAGEVVFSDKHFWPIDTTYYIHNVKNHDWRFLYYFLKTLKLTELNSHSAVPGLNRENVYSIECRFPKDIKVQRSIARILNSISFAINTRESLIAKTQALKTAAMQELFTKGLRGEKQKQTEIGLVPESWGVLKLFEVIIKTKTVDLKNRWNDRIKYIDVSSISREFFAIESNEKFILSEAPGRARKLIKENDVIFATIRPTMKRIAFIGAEFDDEVCSTAFCVLRANEKFLPKYLYYVVQTENFIDQLARKETGASYPAVTDHQLKENLIPQPNQKEQTQIAEILDTIDQKIQHHKHKKTLLEELFNVLLHQLMTGKLRVDDLDLSALEEIGGFNDD